MKTYIDGLSRLCKPNRQAYIRVRILRVLPLLLLLFLFSACDNFVDTDTPTSQLSQQQVFQDLETANAAMVAVYSNMRDAGLATGGFGGLTYKLGLYADELDNYEQMGINYYYSNALFSANDGVLDTWSQAYSQIYVANAVIEGLSSSTAIPEHERNKLIGEALFVRAFIHFYLTNLYGQVPYVSSTDYRVNSVIPKSTVSLMAAYIINDLEKAVDLLPQSYVAERIRPNRYAAYALLARVFLYEGRWAEASDAASAVIGDNQHVMAALDQAFQKDSPETLWQFKTEGNSTLEGQLLIFTSGPPPQVALSEGLINHFEAGDQRKEKWVNAVTDGTKIWYHAYKYKENGNTGTSGEYSVMLRLAEQYLIRAEARARQGEIIGAQQDLNVIRSRAGLDDTAAVTVEQLIEAIQKERRSEFFTEMGHRFFDLKRTGTIDAVLGLAKTGWNAEDKLWPIPSTDLRANPNLEPQNPGY